MKLATRLTLAFTLLPIMTVTIVGILVFRVSQQGIQRDVYHRLELLNLSKVAQVENWIDANQESIERIAQRPLILEYTNTLLQHELGSEQYTETYHRIREEHLNQLIQGRLGFGALFILHPTTGQILVSSDENQIGKYRENEPYFQQGQTTTYVQPPYYLITDGRQTITISTPLRSSNGEVIAVLAGHLNFDIVQDIMKQGLEQHTTADTFLVNAFNFFVTESRFADSTTPNAIHTPATAACLQHLTGINRYDNHRGADVLGAYQWLPEYELCILTEMEAAEELAQITNLRNYIILLGIITAGVGAGMGIIISRTIIDPLGKLVIGTTLIGQGNWDHKVATPHRDEIGQLSRAFDTMTANLKQITASRDELNHQIAVRKQAEAALRERVKELKALQEIGNYAAQNMPLNQYLNKVAQRVSASMQYDEVCIAAIVFENNTYGDPNALKTKHVLESPIHIDDKAVGRLVVAYTQPHGFLTEETAHLRAICDQISQDVQRQRLFQQLQVTLRNLEESNQQLQQFAYVASHDLQEPLRMVTSYLQLFERRYKGNIDDKADTYIHYAVDGAERMKTLINDLLAYSRVTSHGDTFEPTDLNDVLTIVTKDLEVLIAEHHAQVNWNDLPTLTVDRTQFHQLFLNLIINAIKFRADAAPIIEIQARQCENCWEISVSDNGIGIQSDYFEKIFVIFQRLHDRTSYKGTGIGLAICKRIVERHGGHIKVRSQVGQGTTFFFTIPERRQSTNAD